MYYLCLVAGLRCLRGNGGTGMNRLIQVSIVLWVVVAGLIYLYQFREIIGQLFGMSFF